MIGKGLECGKGSWTSSATATAAAMGGRRVKRFGHWFTLYKGSAQKKLRAVVPREQCALEVSLDARAEQSMC